MKKPKIDYYKNILSVLQELKTLQPNVEMGKHLSTVGEDNDGIWGMSDGELHTALIKYKAQLELFVPHETFEEDVLSISLEEDEDEYEGEF